jgi:hypothetical protein
MSVQELQAVLAAGCGQTANCPVWRDARRAAALSQDLGLALRRLRASLRACSRCLAGSNCPLRVDLTDQVRRAVREAAAELREGG